MEKKKIERAYDIGTAMKTNVDTSDIKDLINIGIQAALNDEVVIDDSGNVIRID